MGSLSIVLIVIIAFVAEFIDSSLGMMYGTLLSPILISLGYDPLVVVPSLLLSQALGGLVASIFHNKFNNADFTRNNETIIKQENVGFISKLKNKYTKDLKIVFVISSLGVIATIFASLIAVSIPKSFLKGYIAVLVLIMGMVLLFRHKFKFSWKKMLGLGILSSFNKGLSGGGFGPVVTSGQIISGNGSKKSVAATTLSEAPICITGFITYFLANGFSDWGFVLALSLGAIAAAPLGALFTSKMNEKKLRPILGVLTLGLGIWMVIKLF